MNCKQLLAGLGALTLAATGLLAAPADKKSAPEDTARAHLEETKEQIAKVLSASITQQ